MDVSSCRWRNVVFEANRVYLFLPSTKTDQNKQGTDVPLAKAEMVEHCPVRALANWKGSGEVMTGQDDFVFPSLTDCKKPVSYSAFNDSLRKAATDGQRRVTPHAFRKGFVKTALEKGVDAASVKSFGGWKSDSGFSRYIDTAREWKVKVGRSVLNGRSSPS